MKNLKSRLYIVFFFRDIEVRVFVRSYAQVILLFKAKRNLSCSDEAFRIILLQRHNNFCGVLILVAAGNKKF